MKTARHTFRSYENGTTHISFLAGRLVAQLAANGTQAVTREITEVRAVAGETDAGAEAGLAAAAALGQQADALKTSVNDFLATVRSAA